MLLFNNIDTLQLILQTYFILKNVNYIRLTLYAELDLKNVNWGNSEFD